jgi:hypothetical protein
MHGRGFSLSLRPKNRKYKRDEIRDVRVLYNSVTESDVKLVATQSAGLTGPDLSHQLREPVEIIVASAQNKDS